jgi:hypothetical protein
VNLRALVRATLRALVFAAVVALVPALLASAAGATSGGTAGSSPPGSGASPAASGVPGTAGQPIPVFAYYYIWFNPNSWDRAKMDYPVLGRYSSSDGAVMRRHVEWAQQAGISGFLVSWKDTAVLDRRLALLVKVCEAAHFKLGIVFEGLDFHRRPLPMAEVDNSFSYFAEHYGSSPVFTWAGKPLVIWSGTWEYTSSQLASVTNAYRPRLTILASEKQPSSYEAIASLVDGNAYYWSSVDPLTTPGYQAKLNAFSAAVHGHGGLWVAPAAPGFNAELLGGTRNVPRRGGQTLQLEMDAAIASSPDMIGLISWNEFSENSAIEPSRMYGSSSLKTLAAIDHAHPGAIPDFDSSSPAGSSKGGTQFLILGALLLVFAGSTVALVRRGGSRRRAGASPSPAAKAPGAARSRSR